MSTAMPVYFEQSWAILSSIGMINVLYSTTVIGITNFSPISCVPLVVSAAGAVANGLCYYAFYADYSKTPSLIAAAFADIMWLIQEAGLSFYSYIILIRVLKHQSRQLFMILFWALITIISALRVGILICRARNLITGTESLQTLISRLHIGYFVSIALIEILSAVFLLRKFAAARQTSKEAASTSNLFSYLMRSTEVRLATLALIGITRAITYSFQDAAQSATNVASQVDRFVYTLECMFPVMMFIDILASKLIVTNHIHSSNCSHSHSHSHSHANKSKSTSRTRTRVRETNIALYSMNHIETRVDGNASSSQEHIVKPREGSVGTSGDDDGNMQKGGISKTVEFELRESSAGSVV